MGAGVNFQKNTASYDPVALGTPSLAEPAGTVSTATTMPVHEPLTETLGSPASTPEMAPEGFLALAGPAGFALNALWKADPKKPTQEKAKSTGPLVLHKYELDGPKGKYAVRFYIPENHYTEDQIQKLLKRIEFYNQFVDPQRKEEKIFIWDAERECNGFYACHRVRRKWNGYKWRWISSVHFPVESNFEGVYRVSGHEIGHHLDYENGIQYNEKWRRLARDFLAIHELLYKTGDKTKEEYQKLVFGSNYGLNEIHIIKIKKDGKEVEIKKKINREKEIFANFVEDFYSSPDQLAHNLWLLSQEDIPEKYKQSIGELWDFMENEVFHDQRFTTHEANPFELEGLVKILATVDEVKNNKIYTWFFSYPLETRSQALKKYWDASNFKEREAFLENFWRYWSDAEKKDTTFPYDFLLQTLTDPQTDEALEKKIIALLNKYQLPISLMKEPEKAEATFRKIKSLLKDTNIESRAELQLYLIQLALSFYKNIEGIRYARSGYLEKPDGLNLATQPHQEFYLALQSLTQSQDPGVVRAAQEAIQKLTEPRDLAFMLLGEKIRKHFHQETRRENRLADKLIEVLFSETNLSEDPERDLWALERINDFPDLNSTLVHTLELVILYHENGEVRKRAVEIYVEHRGKPKGKFKRYIFKTREEQEVDSQRKQAIEFLRKARSRELAKFSYRDTEVVKAVQEALNEILRPKLAEYVERRKEIREARQASRSLARN